MNRDILWYLATPFSGELEEYNYHIALEATRALHRAGVAVFSPIVYSYYIDAGMNWQSEEDRTYYWMAFNLSFMELCGGILVLRIPGWMGSEGVKMERDYFRQRRKSELLVDPEELGVIA